MKITELFEAVKTECERCARVLESHAKDKELTEKTYSQCVFSEIQQKRKCTE